MLFIVRVPVVLSLVNDAKGTDDKLFCCNSGDKTDTHLPVKTKRGHYRFNTFPEMFKVRYPLRIRVVSVLERKIVKSPNYNDSKKDYRANLL
ncbi:hypothetical protein SDC9_212057 [bioreactor metagenome]|uniref:Uncharacterized protein n=1 Tax=bioreactor metagenome TaxID=1076179 RepID=A0A645JLK1_9ZZZZ